jgi:hypothetical protein
MSIRLYHFSIKLSYSISDFHNPHFNIHTLSIRQPTGFHGIDIISQYLDYYRIPNDNVYCGGHGLQRGVTILLELVGGKLTSFGRKRQQATKLMSSKHYARLRKSPGASKFDPKFAFQAWPQRLDLVADIIRTKLRYPANSSWERVNALFTRGAAKFDIHDCIQFCSRIGVYVMIQLQLPRNVELIIVDILLAYEDCTLKFYKTADLPGMQQRLVEAFAECDIHLPSHLATAVRHFMQHILGPLLDHGAVRRFGPFHVWSMLTAEQYNKHFKNLSNATKSVEEGLGRGYSARYHSELRRLTNDPSLADPPAYMLPGSHVELPPRTAASVIQVTPRTRVPAPIQQCTHPPHAIPSHIVRWGTDVSASG